MKFVWLLVIGLFYLVGCKSDKPTVEVEGQVFVVTKGRENIKMGLTPIHVVSDEEFRKIASEVASRGREHRLESIQRKANHDAIEKLIEELLSLEKDHADLDIPALENLRKETAARIGVATVQNRFGYDSFGFSKDALFFRLPPAVTKTDADGKFKISFTEKSWVIAKGERSVLDGKENYLWIVPIEDTQKNSSLLVSNDSEFDSFEEFYALVSHTSEEKRRILPSLESGNVDEETSKWVKGVRLQADEAITAAEAAKMAKLKVAEAEKLAKLKVAEAEKLAKLKSVEAERQQRIKQLAPIRRMFSDASRAGGNVLVAWGTNLNNQCDIPSGLTDVVGIAAGESHSLALKKNGTVIAWGDNRSDQCNVPSDLTDVVGIAAGRAHSLALKKDGTVVAWGANMEKQCDIPSGLTDVVKVAAGSGHSLALKKDNTLVAWGDNGFDQCDIPSGLTDVVEMVTGSFHNVALKKNGTVVAWGLSSLRRCDVPSGLNDVVGVAAGNSHNLALKKDGTVVAWGYNGDNECDVPSDLTDVVGVEGGSRYSLVLRKPAR